MKILKFPFAAPFQSWGEDARWDTRSTSACPTKSGIIGFLGCCLGYPRGDVRLNQLDKELRIAVRMDRPGRILTDYQTVQGTGGVMMSADGKPRSGGGTIVTPKQYLQDAWFTVFIQGRDDLVERCCSALRSPRWVPYLGRKNCVPSVPVIPEWVGTGTLEEAVRCFGKNDPECSGKSILVEMDLSAGGELKPSERVYSRNDGVVHAERNEYSPRLVKSYTVSSGGDQS